MSSSFTVDATCTCMVRGYLECKCVWLASLGEKLKCAREVGNRSDVFAVAVVTAGKLLGTCLGKSPAFAQYSCGTVERLHE